YTCTSNFIKQSICTVFSGHSLEEIRVRALENLLSKLEHKLICDADIVNERHLLIRLLEWFNYKEPPKQGDVLHLLLKLSQHTASAEILQDIGAVEFLPKLRADVSSSLQPVIDQILENIFCLPETKVDDHVPACIYTKHGQNPVFVPEDTQHVVPTDRQSHISEGQGQSLIVSGRDGTDGYFTREAVESVQQQQVENWTGTSSGLKVTTFPWLALTPTDRHVLLSTNTSLQCRESHLLCSSCEFLCDVVFQDFPAEIFLQRPNIVKNLLGILGSPSHSSTQLIIHAARTLGNLAALLRNRLRYYQDPALFTPKQDFNSVPSSPFATSPSTLSEQSDGSQSTSRSSFTGWADTRHRGDGRDNDTTSSSSTSRASSVGLAPELANPEETDLEDMQTLQCIQITLPQFVTMVMDKALPLLRTGEEGVVVQLMYLLNQVFDLLVTTVSPQVWGETSSQAREIVERIIKSLEEMSDLIHYHHHGDGSHGNSNHEKDRGDLVQHRLTYTGVAGYMARLLKHLVPVQMAKTLLPLNLMKAIQLLVYDEGLSQSYPEVQITLLAYLQQISPEKYRVYVETAKVAQSMEKTCKFLMLCQEEAYKGSSELITMADGALHSLPYHLHLPLVSEFVKLSSSVCARTTEQADLQSKCTDVLLKFLSHPILNVRQQAYSTAIQVLKGSLSIEEASDPSSRACYLSRFLFHPDVLYQIVVFGLADQDSVVSKLATDVLCHILDSQLLMSEELWAELMANLLKSLPILQTYTDMGSPLGKCLLMLTDPQAKYNSGMLPQSERLRGTLRLMFSSDVRVRAEALKRIAWLMSNEEGSTSKLPVFASLDVTNLTNVFIMETPRSVDDDLGRSVFQTDGLRKVYDIFKSSSVDIGVKKSAVDQLAIILEDHNLHAAFKAENGLNTVLNHIKAGLVKQEDSVNENISYLPACTSIVRQLIHHDYSLRHKLAQDTEIYMNLLRVAFLLQKDDRTCYEVAHIFSLLLFDEVAKFDLGGGTKPIIHFSVPQILKKRCRLPFRPACHHETSPHQVALPNDPDPLSSSPSCDMLKVSWNIAWHGGMEGLLKYLSRKKDSQDSNTEFSAKLHLSCIDKKILQGGYLKEGIKQAVYGISNATSHKAVSSALLRLLNYLVTSFGYGGPEIMFGLDWFTSVGRFMKVQPSLPDDESLLQEVLHFISMALKLTNQVSENTLQWLGEMLYQPSGPLIGLSHRSSVQGETRDVPENVNIKRTLDKELLSFISTYNSKLPYLLCRKLKIQQLRGDLAHQLLQRLNVTDAPHFYNLASLEGTLQCLMHITARPKWSQESTELESSTLCSRVLSSLLEVVSAFHIGRGGTSMSYMGKGVTKAATLCLRHLAYEMSTLSDDKVRVDVYIHDCLLSAFHIGHGCMSMSYMGKGVTKADSLCLRHLAYEMSTLSDDKDWPKQWSYVQQNKSVQTSVEGEEEEENGLNWMLTLWAYRDPEVRTAGLGIAVALTSTEIGRILVASQCKHIPGGIWGAAFSILLDQLECSMVRQQAALLLVNLTSQTMPCGSVELEHNIWQGPIVTDTDFEVSLVGLTALLALLHHSQFYQEMLVVLTNFYAQPTIQTAAVMDLVNYNVSTSSSETTLSTTGNPEPRDEGDVSGNIPSVATPSLVSSICQLIRNLVILAPQDTFTCLKKDSFIKVFTQMLDTNLIEAYITEMQGSHSTDQYDVVFCDLLDMYGRILSLLKACILYDTPTRQDVLADRNFLISGFALLTINIKGSTDMMSKLQDLWRSVFEFFTLALQSQGALALDVITDAVQKLWPTLSGMMETLLENRLDYHKDLFISCQQFLSILFGEEGRLHGRQPELSTQTLTISQMLDESSDEKENKDVAMVTSGSRLCKALIGVYDHVLIKSNDLRNPDRLHAIASLRNLLAISESAKDYAIKTGLVETVIEHVKTTHTKLNLEVLQLGKSAAKKKEKEEPLILDLQLTFDLLRNLLYGNESAKMACYYSGLPSLVHRLWSWCQMEPPLMMSALSLLSTYTAKCPTAASSLAYTTAHVTSASQSGAKVSQQLSSNSLVHCMIKLAGRDGHKDGMLRAVYSVLATLTLSSECRNVIYKSNFLRDFLDLNPRKTKKSKRVLLMEQLWTELLVNLSFSLEGQQMILKTGDSLELLLDFVECCQGHTFECSLLIIRNMCCHGSCKPKLLSNDKLLPQILQCLESKSEKVQTIAASALWALVFNNQKAKVAMKNANLVPKLQDLLGRINEGKRTQEKYIQDLNNVIITVTE
ncbi:hypothetical protein FSP39_015771, partial [Pinctada imbricata]